MEEPQEADAAFQDLLEDADNEIKERIDNKLNQVALIIKVGYKTSQLAHRVWSLQDKYFDKSCPDSNFENFKQNYIYNCSGETFSQQQRDIAVRFTSSELVDEEDDDQNYFENRL